MEAQILITRTRNITGSAIEEIQSVMEPLGFNVKSELHGFKAAGDTPTYIQVLGDLFTWKTVLGITVTAFLAKFAQKAGGDAYDLTKAILKYISSESSENLRKLAKVIFKTAKESEGQTYIAIGFSKPNSWFNSSLKFHASSEQEVQINIALFALKAEAINDAIDNVVMKNGAPSTGVFLEPQNEGGILLKWYDPITHQQKEHYIK